jgi:hypothetical protein
MTSPRGGGGHLFVDESKARDYLMVAAVIVSADLVATRTFARSLIYRGRPRLHMKKDSDARKGQIAAAIVAAGVPAVVFRAAHPVGQELTARAACLEAVVKDAAGSSTHRLVLAVAWCWAKGGHWRTRIEGSSRMSARCRSSADSAKPGSPTSGWLPGSLPEAQRNRLATAYDTAKGAVIRHSCGQG